MSTYSALVRADFALGSSGCLEQTRKSRSNRLWAESCLASVSSRTSDARSLNTSKPSARHRSAFESSPHA